MSLKHQLQLKSFNEIFFSYGKSDVRWAVVVLRSDSFVQMQSVIVVSVNSQCICLYFNLRVRSLNFACNERLLYTWACGGRCPIIQVSIK